VVPVLQGLANSSSDWQEKPTADCNTLLQTPMADCNTLLQQDPAMLQDLEACDSLFASFFEDDLLAMC